MDNISLFERFRNFQKLKVGGKKTVDDCLQFAHMEVRMA